MPTVRVLQVINSMNRGGAESMVMNLYRAIDRSKVQFDFIVHTDKPAAYDEEILSLGGRIYHCPHFSGKNYISYRRWWQRFFAEHNGEYKIIHGHIGSTASIYLREAKKFGLFTIAHSHSSGTDHSLKSRLYKILSYNTRYIADYFFACSEAAGVDRYGKNIVKSDKYHILNNAIDTKLYRFNSEARSYVRNQLGIKENELVLGHVGRFDEAKNQQYVVRILQKIKQQVPGAKALLVGDGGSKDAVMKLAESMNMADSCIFTGIRSDVNCLLQAMDLFVFPSVFEGLPVTLVEAQCAGLPCMISDSIPRDCILTDGLVACKSLQESPKEWAEAVLEQAEIRRMDHSDEIISRGFDIDSTAKWLEEFYLERYNRQ